MTTKDPMFIQSWPRRDTKEELLARIASWEAGIVSISKQPDSEMNREFLKDAKESIAIFKKEIADRF